MEQTEQLPPAAVSAQTETSPTSQPDWIKRFAEKENYSPFSIAILEACQAFFKEGLSPEYRDIVEKMHPVVLVSGSLLRGNARPGSDIDLIVITDRNQTPENLVSTYFISIDKGLTYGKAQTVLETDEMKKFIIQYLREHYPDQYQALFEVRLASLTKSIEGYQAKKNANPAAYEKNSPDFWGNLPPEKRGAYVAAHMDFALETGILDINQNLETKADAMGDEDEFSHCLVALLFSSDLQTLSGDLQQARKKIIEQFISWQKKDPQSFAAFYKTLQGGLQNFLRFKSKNHFYLDSSSQEHAGVVTAPEFDELVASAQRTTIAPSSIDQSQPL